MSLIFSLFFHALPAAAPRFKGATLLSALGLLAACASPEDAPRPAEPPPRDEAARAQTLEAPPPVQPEASEAIIAGAGFTPHRVGFQVQDLESGEILARHNADRGYIPASLTKLGTAIAALEVLGGDHRFETRAMSRARVEDGKLLGDLVLVGGGDPLLKASDLMALCRDLKRQGLRQVAGRLLVDDTLGVRRRAVTRRQPAHAQYNPAISPLSVDFNRIRLHYLRPAGQDTVTAYSVPPVPGLSLDIENPRRGEDRGARWRLEAEQGTVTWHLDPETTGGGRTWVPLKRPALVAGALFRRTCARIGLDLPPVARGQVSADARVMARHASPPLHEIVAAMLEHSNNLVAELLGVAAARELAPQDLTLGASSAVLARWWRETLPDAAWEGFMPRNHSGLSAQSRMTPAQAVAMLRHADGRSYATPGGGRRDFLSLLPASGEAGALGGRLAEPDTALAVWAKTGTMHYASGLAGYLLTGDGRRLAFSIFVSDLAARAAYDPRAAARPEAAVRALSDWRRRAKALEEALVRNWMARFDR
jgi:D-alanyl-D-alanine carboxypeptidase/D-alanyl-D-alanine-endopeptidase (penicillin-binding protein 4)